LEFEKTAISIGRGGRNDLVIQDTTVSQSHATLIYNPRRDLYEMADMGSTNGTFVDGRRIETSIPIDRPRIVVLGAYQLLIYPPEEDVEKGTVVMDLQQAQRMLKDAMLKTSMVTRDEAETLEPRTAQPPEPGRAAPVESPAAVKTRPSKIFVTETSSAPPVTLEFRRGQYAGKSLGFTVQKGGLIFGRDVECQVIFKDPHISRRHFAVHAGETGFYLANLSPANVVQVDGRPVTGDSVWLRNGSDVDCHEEGFRMRWEEKAAPKAAAAPEPAAAFPPGDLGVEEKPLSHGLRKYVLRGDLSINNYYTLENAMLANLGPMQKWALVDMGQVRSLDYPALASLIKVLAEYTKIKGMIAFIGISPALVQIFQLVNVDRYLKKFTFTDENEGVQALLRSRRG
jgi:pSer/pThr/pTyr-binding forkhead associated (FHA) protein/anti-anti-sigma regulatory factor